MPKAWTDYEMKIISEKYPNSSSKELQQFINRTSQAITMKAHLMGVKKSSQWLKDEAIRISERGERCRFVKNHIPFNKGKSMDPETYQKIKHTFIKKGNIPHNTKYDGYTRISKDGYIEVRVRPGKFMLMHRKVWIDHHGEIPKSHAVSFIDGNKLNVDISNLKLISRAELCCRNMIHKYPENIKELIKLNNKLKKQINEKQN